MKKEEEEEEQAGTAGDGGGPTAAGAEGVASPISVEAVVETTTTPTTTTSQSSTGGGDGDGDGDDVLLVVEPRPAESTEGDAELSSSSSSQQQPLKITEASDLSRPDRRIWVVTTAGLPWRTGTSVNPLLRALYLTRGRPKHHVTLMVPWLGDDTKSQEKLYGQVFEHRRDQEEWIRQYCRDRAGCTEEEENLRIVFWDGMYQEAFGSIFPTVDTVSLIPKDEADVAILEEPEHLNWFRVPSPDAASDDDRLGWSHKFVHVVGILHTNYGAYLKQYGGMGASAIAAPALNGLSSLVVKAYCNRVIRLSSTLPSLDPQKEVTCNVHGVRQEFLDALPKQLLQEKGPDDDSTTAKVYFIGKLIWAKGFYDVLDLQDKVNQESGEFFPMDIYGNGDDVEAIKRAFFGRKKRKKSTDGDDNEEGEEEEDETEEGEETENEEKDEEAAEVFGKRTSLREQLCEVEYATLTNTDSTAEQQSPDEVAKEGAQEPADNAPLDILGDLSGRALSTGGQTADAAYQLLETSLRAVFGKNDNEDEEEGKEEDKKEGADESETGKKKGFPFPLPSLPRPHRMKLVPRRARYKWRQTPIPARFLGVQDHIVLRDLPQQYIFLNMSTSEVLCTTTAEALAMGKFVIIPKHPSNEFFYQFPNCLAYINLDDCVVKLMHALKSEPEPLTDLHAHILSWEGATERLYRAASITEDEWKEWEETGVLEADEKAAKFLVESEQKSQFVRNLFSRKRLAQSSSSLSTSST